MAKKTKKSYSDRNPQDITLRNLRAAKIRIVALDTRLKVVEKVVYQLETVVLKKLTVIARLMSRKVAKKR